MANLPRGDTYGNFGTPKTSPPPSGGGPYGAPIKAPTTRPAAAQRATSGNDWILPVVGMSHESSKFTGSSPAWATGSYGYRKPASKGGHTHQGVDIYAKSGAAVVSPTSGTIKSVGKGGAGGNYVKVKGDDGYEYYFAHMQYSSPSLAAGQRVNQGAFLGGVGNTGNAQGTGAHLHFEIRKNGNTVNPNGFLSTGKVQNDVPLSSIGGLSTPEQLQAYIDEQVSASYNMNALAAEEAGFDPSVWGGGEEATEDDLQRQQTQKGQSFLGSTLNSMSNALAGGTRTPMMSSAMQATEGGDRVPTAADQRQIVEES